MLLVKEYCQRVWKLPSGYPSSFATRPARKAPTKDHTRWAQRSASLLLAHEAWRPTAGDC